MSSQRQGFARLRAPGGIADHAREVPEDHDDLVAEILKVAQLAQDHGVPEVEIGGGRIEPELDPQRRAAGPRPLELGPQLALDDDVRRAAPEDTELLVDGGEREASQSIGVVSRGPRAGKARRTARPV